MLTKKRNLETTPSRTPDRWKDNVQATGASVIQAPHMAQAMILRQKGRGEGGGRDWARNGHERTLTGGRRGVGEKGGWVRKADRQQEGMQEGRVVRRQASRTIGKQDRW